MNTQKLDMRCPDCGSIRLEISYNEISRQIKKQIPRAVDKHDRFLYCDQCNLIDAYASNKPITIDDAIEITKLKCPKCGTYRDPVNLNELPNFLRGLEDEIKLTMEETGGIFCYCGRCDEFGMSAFH